MSEQKNLNAGRELTDEELMAMTGGSSFYQVKCQKNYSPNNIKKPDQLYLPVYGIPSPEYGVPMLRYGIPALDYGIQPRPVYGIDPSLLK